jgi:hypothetical protein
MESKFEFFLLRSLNAPLELQDNSRPQTSNVFFFRK